MLINNDGNRITNCGIPKSNDNGKYKREIEREEENGG